jgi:hypothetical protein
MMRSSRPLAIAGAASALTVLAAIAPALFRRMETFRVQTVEVTGTRYLTPEATLLASGITDSASVFDDTDEWADRLRAERLIANAEVHRRLPGTLRIDVVENEPVALIRTPELRPVDANGRVLPIGVGAADLDLPVIAMQTQLDADSVADDRTLRLIGGLLSIHAYDTALAGAVSEIDEAHGGGLRFLLREPAHAELLLPDGPSARTLQQVLLAFDHMRSDGEQTGETAYERLTRIDARYEDELFVTTRPARANGR